MSDSFPDWLRVRLKQIELELTQFRECTVPSLQCCAYFVIFHWRNIFSLFELLQVATGGGPFLREEGYVLGSQTEASWLFVSDSGLDQLIRWDKFRAAHQIYCHNHPTHPSGVGVIDDIRRILLTWSKVRLPIIIPSQMEVAPLHCSVDITQKRRTQKRLKRCKRDSRASKLTKFSLINCFEHMPAIPLDRHPTSIV